MDLCWFEAPKSVFWCLESMCFEFYLQRRKWFLHFYWGSKHLIEIRLDVSKWRVFQTDEAQYWETMERFCLVGSTSLRLWFAVFDTHRLPCAENEVCFCIAYTKWVILLMAGVARRVPATVFKTDEACWKILPGGFDSHRLPPLLFCDNMGW